MVLLSDEKDSKRKARGYGDPSISRHLDGHNHGVVHPVARCLFHLGECKSRNLTRHRRRILAVRERISLPAEILLGTVSDD